jgi:hypothetical protein
MSAKPAITQKDLSESMVNLCRVLNRTFLENNNPAAARELVERMRITADELMADINAYAQLKRKP